MDNRTLAEQILIMLQYDIENSTLYEAAESNREVLDELFKTYYTDMLDTIEDVLDSKRDQ